VGSGTPLVADNSLIRTLVTLRFCLTGYPHRMDSETIRYP
jgi:hypothetical protein